MYFFEFKGDFFNLDVEFSETFKCATENYPWLKKTY